MSGCVLPRIPSRSIRRCNEHVKSAILKIPRTFMRSTSLMRVVHLEKIVDPSLVRGSPEIRYFSARGCRSKQHK